MNINFNQVLALFDCSWEVAELRDASALSSVYYRVEFSYEELGLILVVTVGHAQLESLYKIVLKCAVIESVFQTDIINLNCEWLGNALGIQYSGIISFSLCLKETACVLLGNGGLHSICAELNSEIDFYFDFNMEDDALVDIVLGTVSIPASDYFSLCSGSIIEIPCSETFPVNLVLDGQIVEGEARVEEGKIIVAVL